MFHLTHVAQQPWPSGSFMPPQTLCMWIIPWNSHGDYEQTTFATQVWACRTVTAWFWNWKWLFLLLIVWIFMKVDSKADVFFVHSELQWNLKLHLNIYLGEKNWGKKLHNVLNSKELESYKVISKQNTSWIDFLWEALCIPGLWQWKTQKRHFNLAKYYSTT